MPRVAGILQGVIAAAVTPLHPDGSLDLEAVPGLLEFLAGRGCHGALLLGTTGEGPSFSIAERLAVIRAGLRYRDAAPHPFFILAGTGCASLTDTIGGTRSAFELGVDAVVVLPPFYFKGLEPSGLAAYFEQVIHQAVPPDGRLLVYHIPQVSGVPVPDATVAELRRRHPDQVWGMKDSQDELPHLLTTAAQFPGFHVFSGSDSILVDALRGGAAGSITALANVTSPLNRAVWDTHQSQRAGPPASTQLPMTNDQIPFSGAEAQTRLGRARVALRGLNGPAAMKAALAYFFGFPLWPVRPPLQPLPADKRQVFVTEMEAILRW